jgi:DNA-binding NarL/FixJ family response regulator
VNRPYGKPVHVTPRDTTDTIPRTADLIVGPTVGKNETIEVLLVDMQDLVRSGFSLALRNEPDIDVVAEANTGELALSLAAKSRPDVIVMDIWMPDFDGALKIMARIREIPADIRPEIVILTSFKDDRYLFLSLQAGASGFLLKGASREELVDAVRQVHHGHAVVCPEMTRRLLDRFEIRPVCSLVATADVATERLSKRELEVMRCVAEGKSNQEIADDLYLAPATVKSHVSSVLSKLELRDRLQVALYAHGTGMIPQQKSDYRWRADHNGPVLASRR